MRARCFAYRHCPNPLGIVTLQNRGHRLGVPCLFVKILGATAVHLLLCFPDDPEVADLGFQFFIAPEFFGIGVAVGIVDHKFSVLQPG